MLAVRLDYSLFESNKIFCSTNVISMRWLILSHFHFPPVLYGWCPPKSHPTEMKGLHPTNFHMSTLNMTNIAKCATLHWEECVHLEALYSSCDNIVLFSASDVLDAVENTEMALSWFWKSLRAKRLPTQRYSFVFQVSMFVCVLILNARQHKIACRSLKVWLPGTLWQRTISSVHLPAPLP